MPRQPFMAPYIGRRERKGGVLFYSGSANIWCGTKGDEEVGCKRGKEKSDRGIRYRTRQMDVLSEMHVHEQKLKLGRRE